MECASCGEGIEAGHILLRDDRPDQAVEWPFCSEACFAAWLDGPRAKALFPAL
jgi:hypothetical protein